MPSIFGFRKWFENRFGDLCDEHDANYAAGMKRVIADRLFADQVAARGYKKLALVCYVSVRLFGYFHYMR